MFVVLMALMAFIWLREVLSEPPPVSACFGGGYRSEVRGRVADYPVVRGGSSSFAFRGESSEPPGCAGLLFVRLRGAPAPVFGQGLVLEGFGAAPAGARHPGDMDWGAYLRNRGFSGEFYADKSVAAASPALIRRLSSGLRLRTMGLFSSALTEEKASVTAGVVLGEKRNISASDKRAFQDAGAMHLLVASGVHVGFVTLLVYSCASLAGLRRHYAAPLTLLLSGLYVLTAGFGTPLLRAYLMYGAGLVGYALGRGGGAFHGLTLAGLVLLLIRPQSLFDASFQMSFLAAYSVAAGTGSWQPLLKRLSRPAAWAAGLFLVSFFAQAGLAPALASYFRKISLIAPVSNLALVPLSGLLMFSGFALSVLDGFPLLGTLSAWLVSVVSGLFLWLVRSFASFEHSSMIVRVPTLWHISGWGLLCFVLLHLPLFAGRRRAAAGISAAGAALLAAGLLLPASKGALAFGGRGGGAVLLSGDGRSSVLVSSGLPGNILAGAALASGYAPPEEVLLACGTPSCAEGLDELAGVSGLKKIYLPAWAGPGVREAIISAGAEPAALWPGDSFAAGGFRVTADWAGVCGGEPPVPGYSGGGSMSYILESENFSFRTGEGACLAGEK